MTKPATDRSFSASLPSAIHFVGIGGAGMAPLAHLALAGGAKVSGSDSELNSKTAALVAAGAVINTGHRAENLPDATELLVFSSAVSGDNPELAKAASSGIPCIRRGEFLALIASRYRRSAAVSGSHGKSTISAMLAHICDTLNMTPGWYIGAELNNTMPSSAAGNGDIFVLEADESDGTHTALAPYLGIVSNLDDDHVWSLGGIEVLHRNFRTFADSSQKLLYGSSAITEKLFCGHKAAESFPLSAAEGTFAGFYGFQAMDAKLAVRAAEILGADREAAIAALQKFPGVARRMTVHLNTPDLLVIEDYAHHPAELRASLEFLRKKYPDHELRILFQPHRFARLKRYFDDFSRVLNSGIADTIFIAPVFAAWCESGYPDHKALAGTVAGAEALDNDWQKCAGKLFAPSHQRPVAAAVIGAGDVNRVLRFVPAAE